MTMTDETKLTLMMKIGSSFITSTGAAVDELGLDLNDPEVQRIVNATLTNLLRTAPGTAHRRD